MAKRKVKISLATKFRLLFGVAVVCVIASALAVPWYFTELLGEQGLERPAMELARLRLNEWVREHPRSAEAARKSRIASLYTADPEYQQLKGPVFVRIETALKPGQADRPTLKAIRALSQNPDQMLAVIKQDDEQGQTIYRCFRPVRVEATCAGCHNQSMARPDLRFQPDQLVAMIDVWQPPSAATGTLVWLTRGAFLIGALVAGVLAMVIFSLITQRLVLRPVGMLTSVADKVAEGDLTTRSTISTYDELQRMGESFNQMLAAIQDQHDRLTSANKALDVKLHELAEANVTLFQANKVKSEFLANVSHELRTPLNSIIGFADLLAGWTDERVQRYSGNISLAAKNLLSMINDMLDLAKIEAGKAVVRLDKFSVSDTCQTLMALMRPLADKKQLDLKSAVAADLPIVVSDVGKVQQILYNLLSNAIKFTPAGGAVTLRASMEPAPKTGPAEVVLAVEDTGPGIPEADQPLIFEKFYQAGKTLTKESTGTGLGLAISRELANLLGGRLTFKSTPGHGAVFTLALPVEPPQQSQ